MLNVTIPNTTIETSGTGRTYRITPNEGYVLHDKAYDTILEEEVENPETGEMEWVETGVILGYRTTQASVSVTYDFTPFEMLDEAGNTVTAYGSRQFYTKPIGEVPTDQIFGGGNTDTEIM